MHAEIGSDRRILIVDDEKVILDLLSVLFKKNGFQVLTAENAFDALQILSEEEIPIVITDIKMPQMDGIELLRRIKSQKSFSEVIMITGFASVDSALEAVKLGAFDYLKKPLNELERVMLVVNKALEKRQLQIDYHMLQKEVASSKVIEDNDKSGKIIKEWMNQDIITAVLEESVFDVVKKMADNNVGAVVISDTEYKPLGIFTKSDLIKRVVVDNKDLYNTKIKDVMSAPVQVIEETECHTVAWQVLKETGINYLPVVKDNRLVGMISVKDFSKIV